MDRNIKHRNLAIMVCLFAAFAYSTVLAQNLKNDSGKKAKSDNQNTNKLLVDVWTTEKEYSQASSVRVGITFTNISGEPINQRLPHKWNSITKDQFILLHDGKKVVSSSALIDIEYLYVTTLQADESVTVVSDLTSLFNVPVVGDAKRIGKYEIRTGRVTDNQGQPWLKTRNHIFWISTKKTDVHLGVEFIKSDEDIERARLLLHQCALMPADKLALLRMAVNFGKKEAVWKLIERSNDVYAIVTLLEKLPKKMLDKEGLFKLLKRKSLSIRRSAISSMAKLGKDAEVAKRLNRYLKTQKDVPTLNCGKEALVVLERK